MNYVYRIEVVLFLYHGGCDNMNYKPAVAEGDTGLDTKAE
jgi:hypothetical protein